MQRTLIFLDAIIVGYFLFEMFLKVCYSTIVSGSDDHLDCSLFLHVDHSSRADPSSWFLPQEFLQHH